MSGGLWEIVRVENQPFTTVEGEARYAHVAYLACGCQIMKTQPGPDFVAGEHARCPTCTPGQTHDPEGTEPAVIGKRGTCASCGAEILWVTTRAGKAMPLDAAPDPHGNVTIEEFEVTLLGKAMTIRTVRVWGRGRAPDSAVHYMPHHATCPEGAQWRKP